MAGIGRIDAFQRRHRWAAVPVAVGYKFVDDDGPYLAATLTYYGFLSLFPLFPLLLLGVTSLGFALRDDPVAQQAVLSSALRNFPIIGDQLRANVGSLQGSWVALLVGATLALYGALGVTHAAQHALNRVWAVPRASRPSVQAAYGRGLLMVLLIGLGLALATGLSAAATSAATVTGLGGIARGLSVVLAVALNVGLFLLTYQVLTPRPLPARQFWVGALVAGATWQLVLSLGTYLLGTRLQGASATYGLFGIVLGLLAWIYIAAVVFVVCAELDAVLGERLYPRSLASMFPDASETTPADRRALASYAETERQKSFQNVDVSFEAAAPTSDGQETAQDPGQRASMQDTEALGGAGEGDVELGRAP